MGSTIIRMGSAFGIFYYVADISSVNLTKYSCYLVGMEKHTPKTWELIQRTDDRKVRPHVDGWSTGQESS